MNTKHVHCECGEWTSERCAWTGPIDQTVLVEYMPKQYRASHTAAGNPGVYPHNGAVRVRVERTCAELLLADESEQEWAWIVGDDMLEDTMSEVTDRVAVWGRGPATASLFREGEATDAAVGTAARYGFHLRGPDDWAVEVAASEVDVDAATRHDAAVLGWAPLLVESWEP